MSGGTFLAWKHYRRSSPKSHSPTGPLFPISILKPVKDLDEGGEENLRSFFHLDYSEFEIIFSVADHEDPARPVIENLLREYPHVKARLIVGDIPLGPNPKVNNLIRGFERARYDWILISDSNVRVSPDYLASLAKQVKPETGLVTSSVVGSGMKNIGAHLESTFLNSFLTRWMVFSHRLARPLVLGKSMLFRRSVAERFGGIKILSPFLAEDYMAGEAMRALGYEVTLSLHPVDQYLGNYPLRQFWKRHVRWGRIRKSQAPLVFLIEPWTGALGSGLLGARALSQLLPLSFIDALVLHLLFWLLCDLIIFKCVKTTIHWKTSLAWLAREILSLPLWFHTLMGNLVEWRGKKLKLQSGGILGPI